MNLQLYILKEVLYKQVGSSAGSRGVPLSDFRKEVGIPNSTFHRAVKSLVDANLLTRVHRDRYSVSLDMIDHCEIVKKDMRHEIQ